MFKIKKIHPMFTGVVTTAVRYTSEEAVNSSGLIVDTRKFMGAMNNYQTVIAVGPMVKEIKPGDVVCINFDRYAVASQRAGKLEDNIQDHTAEYSYRLPCIDLDGVKCLMIQSNDIEYYMQPGDFEVDDGGVFE